MRWRRRMAAIALGLLGTAMTPHDLHACGNGVEERMDALVAGISRAERDVNRGETMKAARGVLAQFPSLRQMKPTRGNISDRAMRIMALAIVRSQGQLNLKPGFPGETDEQRANNITWAQRMLRGFSQRSGRDAAAETAYAEAIALSEPRRAEAKRILTRLAKADLLTSPQGYATLSRLYATTDDSDVPAFLRAARKTLGHGRQRLADARCRRMAAEPKVCGEHLGSPEG